MPRCARTCQGAHFLWHKKQWHIFVLTYSGMWQIDLGGVGKAEASQELYLGSWGTSEAAEASIWLLGAWPIARA